MREEGASQACPAEVPWAPASKRCLQFKRLAHCWVDQWAVGGSVFSRLVFVPLGGVLLLLRIGIAVFFLYLRL